MSLEKNRRVTLSVVAWPTFLASPPPKSLGVWKTRTGGGVEADVVRDYPGGMDEEEILTAAPSGEDVEVTRTFKLGRDDVLRNALRKSVSYIWIEVQDQYMDDNKQPYGSPTIYRAKLAAYKEPDADSGSNDLATVSVTLAVPASGITA